MTSTAKTHAKFSPSGMAANMACIGKIAMEDGLPNTSSKFADEGTCAHFLGAWCLDTENPALEYLGAEIVLANKDDEYFEGFRSRLPVGYEVKHTEQVTETFAAHVQTYIDHVRDYAQGHKILVEQKLSIEAFTGEKGATGTADASALLPEEIFCGDAKFGRIPVHASDEIENDDSEEEDEESVEEGNVQLMAYALALYLEHRGTKTSFTDNYQPKQVRLVIIQPMINHVSEYVCSVEDLLKFGELIHERANLSFIALAHKDNWIGTKRQDLYLNPGAMQCRWCLAAQSGRCGALDAKVVGLMGRELNLLDFTPKANQTDIFVTPEQLGDKLRAIPLVKKAIEGYAVAGKALLNSSCNSEEVRKKLGFKLVQGKRGNQAWESEAVGEKLVRRMVGAKNAYDKKLKSPTKIKEMLKGDDKKLQIVEKYIRQAEGKPSVAPISDKREALVLQDLSFDNLEDDLI